MKGRTLIHRWRGSHAKQILSAAIVFILTVGIIIFAASEIYGSVRENLMLHGEISAMQSAELLDREMAVNQNSLILTAYVVDNMVQKGVSPEEILRYITEESDRISQTIDPDYNGIYGWIGGEYLDGGGWVPDEGYVPTERPWYVEAVARGPRELVFVEPYLDMETNTVIITVAQCLSDGESVIALDIALDDMETIVREIVESLPGSQALVLDHRGGVVVHSDRTQMGMDYMDQADTLGRMVADRIIEKDEKQFSVEYRGEMYVVYSETIKGGWHSVSIINAEDFYAPLNRVLVLTLAALVLAMAYSALVFVRVVRSSRAMRNLNVRLSTIAEIYGSVHDIDLKRGTLWEINDHAAPGDAPVHGGGNAQMALYERVDRLVNENSRDMMREFLDLSTLPGRLEGRKTVTVEYLNSDDLWCRGRFIVAGRDAEGAVSRVLWATESIDEEKRMREHLVYLSETDQLTDIYNRGGGERRIREALKRDGGGMFILLDVDNFKHYNDRYGHRVGDKVLVAVANCMKNSFRTRDIVMRLGGDEFAAYAPGVHTEEVGRRIVNRLFDSLQGVNIRELGGEAISVSVGVAISMPGATTSFRRLYGQADQRAYESKKSEGNQVTFQ